MSADEICEWIYAHKPMAIAMLWHVTPDSLADLLQDACVRALDAAQRVQIRDPESYLTGLMIHTAHKHNRALLRCRREIEIDPKQRSTTPSPYETTLLREQRAIALAEVLSLPKSLRDPVYRGYLVGEPNRATRQALGISPTLYRLRKNRGKARITGKYV